jgi:hypothetical protein
MFVNQREMPEDESQAILESTPEPLDDRVGASAIRAFKIAVGHYRDECAVGSDDVIVFTDVQSVCCMDR